MPVVWGDTEQFVVDRDTPFSQAALWAIAHSMEELLEAEAIRPGLLTPVERKAIERLAESAAETAMQWSSKLGEGN